MKLADPILSIDEAAELTPWSKSTLYRIAPAEDSPFHKRGGRWVTTESDLLEWARTGPKPRNVRAESPMPRPRCRRGSNFAAKVLQLEGAS
jgi:excisionase family DNA binding protein